MDPGLYIVTLNNDEPISVNANDSRIADTAIKVTKANCKVGKAQSFERRAQQYYKVFGEHNVNFTPVALVEDLQTAELAVLAKLDPYRVRGRTGRRNEWLENIDFNQVLKIVLRTLEGQKIPYTRI